MATIMKAPHAKGINKEDGCNSRLTRDVAHTRETIAVTAYETIKTLAFTEAINAK